VALYYDAVFGPATKQPYHNFLHVTACHLLHLLQKKYCH